MIMNCGNNTNSETHAVTIEQQTRTIMCVGWGLTCRWDPRTRENRALPPSTSSTRRPRPPCRVWQARPTAAPVWGRPIPSTTSRIGARARARANRSPPPLLPPPSTTTTTTTMGRSRRSHRRSSRRKRGGSLHASVIVVPTPTKARRGASLAVAVPQCSTKTSGGRRRTSSSSSSLSSSRGRRQRRRWRRSSSTTAIPITMGSAA